MIASWLRRLLLFEALVYGALILWLAPAESSAILNLLLGVPALILLARVLWLLNIHAFAAAFRQAVPVGAGGPRNALRGYFSELWAMLYLFAGLQCLPRWFDREPAAQGTGPLVLLVHGFGCNGAVWWPMRRWLEKRCRAELHTVTLEPVLVDLDRLVEPICQRLRDWQLLYPQRRVLLVGHSMGGILARRSLQTLGDTRGIQGLVTLGSPHAGTALARFHPAPNAVQMRPGSDWLLRLDAGTDPCPLTCIATWHDHVVVPQNSAACRGSTQVWLCGVGHLALLLDGRVRQMLLRELTASDTIQSGSRA